MPRKLVLLLLVVSLGSIFAFVALQSFSPLPDIEVKGPESTATVQYVALATAIVSLMTAIVGLVKTTKKSGGGDT